jgi:hypothetical protein
MKIEELIKSLEFIRQALDRSIDPNNPTDCTEKLGELNALQGLSAECYASAESILNKKLFDAVKEFADNKVSASEKKYLYQGFANREIYYFNLSEKYNKEIHYQIESLRTFISNLKMQYQNGI